MKLINKKNNTEICSEFNTAETFKQRLVGLIGKKEFHSQALMFESCKWIHTCFMSMPIDVIYVDKTMKIKKIDHSLQPWTIPAPVFSAWAVIETEAGVAKDKQLSVGDELYVGH